MRKQFWSHLFLQDTQDRVCYLYWTPKIVFVICTGHPRSCLLFVQDTQDRVCYLYRTPKIVFAQATQDICQIYFCTKSPGSLYLYCRSQIIYLEQRNQDQSCWSSLLQFTVSVLLARRDRRFAQQLPQLSQIRICDLFHFCQEFPKGGSEKQANENSFFHDSLPHPLGLFFVTLAQCLRDSSSSVQMLEGFQQSKNFFDK